MKGTTKTFQLNRFFDCLFSQYMHKFPDANTTSTVERQKALVPGAIITCIYYAVKMCSITETAATLEREVEEWSTAKAYTHRHIPMRRDKEFKLRLCPEEWCRIVYFVSFRLGIIFYLFNVKLIIVVKWVRLLVQSSLSMVTIKTTGARQAATTTP